MSWHIVHTEASQGWGGQEIRILTESTGMMEKGHRITLLTPRTATIHDEAKKLGIDVVAMPFEKRTIANALATRRWLKENPVDLINTHSSIDSWLVGLARIGLSNAPPVVRTRHISAPLRLNWGTRWIYTKSAQRVATTGESLRQGLIDQLGASPETVRSIPTGIDTTYYDRASAASRDDMRTQSGIPADATVLGIVATLRSWKGHLDLIDAFDSLATKHAGLHLLIVGDGPMRDRIEERVGASPAGTRIHIVGQQSNVPDWLAAMDIFVLPSYANEGVPQSIMQAMALNLPVISTDVGAITDVLKDGENGLLTEPQNPVDLAGTIGRLLDDNELRSRLAANTRDWIESRFSKRIMVNDMEALFGELIQ